MAALAVVLLGDRETEPEDWASGTLELGPAIGEIPEGSEPA